MAFNLADIMAHGVTQAEFARVLCDVDLSQRDLARLGGFSPSTVNRWCSPERKDKLPPPRHAIILALLWGMLASDQRSTIRSLL